MAAFGSGKKIVVGVQSDGGRKAGIALASHISSSEGIQIPADGLCLGLGLLFGISINVQMNL